MTAVLWSIVLVVLGSCVLIAGFWPYFRCPHCNHRIDLCGDLGEWPNKIRCEFCKRWFNV